MGKGVNSKKAEEKATINVNARKLLQQLEREEEERTAPPPQPKEKKGKK